MTLKNTYTPISSKSIMKLEKGPLRVELSIYVELYVYVFEIVCKKCEQWGFFEPYKA